ncbi:MAG: DUF445 domain-containing protein [Actinomycetota bacterium]
METVDDRERATALRRMKAVALGLLVLAAAIYAIATAAGAEGAWGYVQAGAEAAMVGAIADWFAVVALFRHPLGLPIPHTAIVARRKDEIGRGLGDFVEQNFLTADVLTDRLAEVEVGRHLGEWLRDPANATRVSARLGDVADVALSTLDDDQVQGGIEGVVRERLAAMPAAPLLGTAIERSVADGHHHRLVDALVVGLDTFLDDNRETLQARMYEESPWFVPERVDDRVLAKIYDVITRFLADVRADPNHELRRSIDERIEDFTGRLETDRALISRTETFKDELLDHPSFRSWIATLWLGTKAGLLDAANDADGELRQQATAAIQQFGEQLIADPELQAQVDRWVEHAATQLVERYRSEVSDLIATTVERWDTESTTRRIELQVGRDLQFIRINGTVVGAIAGLVIHTVSELL